MRNHTTAYEQAIKTFGRQQAIRITFDNVVLTGDDINSCTPSFKASLLKSCMKEVRIDSNTEIPVGTEIHLEHGILVGNSYEYLDYGYYTVYKVEKKEDTSSFDILCYDKMILAMVDYIDLGIDFPITIRNYIAEICNHLEIDFGSNQDQFVNYDKEIPSELYLDENGDSLNYTFRDVLDEIAQVTASVICIDNENKLVVKYPQRQGEFETLEGTALYIENADDTKIDLELQGNTSQNGTPTPTSPVEVNNVTGEQVVTICGKNLLNYSAFVKGRLNASTGQIEHADKVTNFSTTENTISFTATQAWNNGVTSGFIPFRSGTYIIKGTITGQRSPVYVDYYNTDKSWLSRYSNTNMPFEPGVTTSYVLNLNNSNASYIRIHFEASTAGDVTITNLQLEKGTSATSFEKYQGKDYEINLGGDNLVDWSSPNSLSGYTFENNTIQMNIGSGTYTNRFWDIKNLYKANAGKVLRFDFKSITKDRTGTPVQLNIRYNDGTANKYIALVSNSLQIGTHQIPSDTSNVEVANFSIYANNSGTNQSGTITIEEPMLHFGSTEQEYTPYTATPIELNKIGNYQDFIRKGTGKNLFGATMEMGTINGTTGEPSDSTTRIRTSDFINVKSNTSYTLSIKETTSKTFVFQYDKEGGFISRIPSSWNVLPYTFTTSDNVSKIKIVFNKGNDETITLADVTNIQIEENSSATYYEPYGYKDKWYLEKNVEKVILNGSENWSLNSNYTNNVFYTIIDNINKTSNVKTILSNYYNGVKNQGLADFGNNYNYSICSRGYNDAYYHLYISNDSISSVADFKIWLQSNNTKVYYVLANTTYTLIENEELLNQLEVVQLQTGLNNVLVSGDLPSTIKVGYVEEFKSIDEEQLKDINVNFGEKFGPINSVVIARAADSDFIYKEDEQSVEENGLCEIRISDNQILNDDSRVEFLDGIYYQLRGIEYYLNDFSSTGITYLDLLDYYKVNVFDNSYKCLMLNDDIKVTQGIEEQVHTEMPETTETEYKALSKQDKDIRKIGIIVNKVDGEITAEIIARQNTDENVSRLQQSINEISSVVSTTTEQVNDIETIVNEQSTTISQTAEGLSVAVANITSVQDGLETLETNTQDVVNQLVFGADGLTISNKGSSSEDMKLNLTNDAIKFLYQNNAVLTINGSVIEFSNASFRKLDLGNYVWQAEDDDSLSLIYES